MQFNLTAGAIRTFLLSAELAKQSDLHHIDASHILWSLVLQESRAGELLGERGISLQVLQELITSPANGFDTSILGQVSQIEIDAADGLPHSLAQQATIQRVLQQARERLADILTQTELGTEHLLFGLIHAEPRLADSLNEFGVNDQFLLERITGRKSQKQPPLETEFTLRYRENHETEDLDTLRILDASANRAREGLRVLEDYVRFVLDDAHLAARLKSWRHELSQALRSLAPHRLLNARETEHDVGTQIHTLTETRRDSLLSVVQANFKRVEEAVRTLEEYSKVISESLGQQIGQLRYGIYTLEKAVLQTRQARERLTGRNLYMLVTEDLCHHGSGPAVRGAMKGGVGIVQLREKHLPDRQLMIRARRMREWTRESDVLFIMNDRPDLAVLADADGVHVGQEELSVKDARRIIGPDKLIGVSTHSIEQARQAVLDGADYIGVGPVFRSSTKSFDAFVGLDLVKQVAEEISLPAFAIGGINLENLDQVLAAGAERIAVTAALCGSEKPFEVAVQFRTKIR